MSSGFKEILRGVLFMPAIQSSTVRVGSQVTAVSGNKSS